MGRELPQGTAVGVCTIDRLRERRGLYDIYSATGPTGQAYRVSVFYVDPDGQAWKHFVAEAQQVKTLSHPCVVDIVETAVTSSGLPFQVVQLGPGEALSERLRRSGALTTTEALSCAQQVGSALSALHSLDLLHRGLSPEQIFVCEGDPHIKPRVRLLDVGVSRLLDDAVPGGLWGSPEYKAPEQLTGFSIDVGPASDEYALALVLYQSLTSSRPFKADSAASTILQVVRGGAEPLRVLRPDIPKAVDAAVMRALAKERTGRFPSVAEFLTALQGGEPIDRALDELIGPWLRGAASTQAVIQQAQAQADSKPSFQVVALQMGGDAAVPMVVEDQATVPNTMEEVMRLAVPIERISYSDARSPSSPAVADRSAPSKAAAAKSAAPVETTDRNPLIESITDAPSSPSAPSVAAPVPSGPSATTNKVASKPAEPATEATGPMAVPSASATAAPVKIADSAPAKTSSLGERIGLIVLGLVLGFLLRHLLG